MGKAVLETKYGWIRDESTAHRMHAIMSPKKASEKRGNVLKSDVTMDNVRGKHTELQPKNHFLSNNQEKVDRYAIAKVPFPFKQIRQSCQQKRQ